MSVYPTLVSRPSERLDSVREGDFALLNVACADPETTPLSRDLISTFLLHKPYWLENNPVFLPGVPAFFARMLAHSPGVLALPPGVPAHSPGVLALPPKMPAHSPGVLALPPGMLAFLAGMLAQLAGKNRRFRRILNEWMRISIFLRLRPAKVRGNTTVSNLINLWLSQFNILIKPI